MLDIRNPPGHSPNAILADIRALLEAALTDGAIGTAEIGSDYDKLRAMARRFTRLVLVPER